MNYLLLVLAILSLLWLVLHWKLPAFLALLLVSLVFGLLLGMDGKTVLASVQSGMASTLGFVAIVVGLGAMLGGLLEYAGGVQVIADRMLLKFGERRATWCLGAIGFLVAIPVFFDVAFIILVPLVLRLSRSGGRAPIYYALPLLAGLAVAHAYIPPTPGPIAVAELLGADLGWVITMGALCGLPAMILAGPIFARRFAHLPRPSGANNAAVGEPAQHSASLLTALSTVLLPLVLIVASTASGRVLDDGALKSTLVLLGHPFVALSIACVYAYYVFGVRHGVPREKLQQIMTRALEPAGIVVLITGAGGVFKQILVDSGVGRQLGALINEQALPILLLAFLIAALVRISQGSATVAMITAAGLIAPALEHAALSAPQAALLVIAISSGATIASHVNDSGFWLVNRYLGQTEKETLQSWTVASTIAGCSGFATAALISLFV